MSTTSIHTSPKSFPEAQYGFVDRVLWQLVPYQPQNFLELIDVLRLGLKWLVAFKHSSPDMVVQRVEVRRVRRPLTFTIEFTAVGIAIQSWASFGDCRVCMRAVLLKYEARWQKWQNRSWILNKFRQQGYNIQLAFTLAVSGIKCNLPFPPKQTPVETITCLANFTLSATSNVGVKAGDGNFEHTLKWTTCQILVFVITVNVSWQWKLQVAVDHSVQN